MTTAAGDGHRAAEYAARQSYGVLIAVLARETRDIAAAEDALGTALTRALERWPVDGVPANPAAWLLTVARRAAVDAGRAAATVDRLSAHLALLDDERRDVAAAIPDPRLALMFACAAPAIDERSRAPLMLQTLLGIDARRMASAFVTAPGTMSQRLVRAKAKIKVAAVRFAVPDADELPARVGAVLDAIYAAYTLGWDAAFTGDAVGDLAAEAVWLGRVVVDLLPTHPEATALLALMLFGEARRGARRTADGAFIPLSAQDVTKWSPPMIAEAEGLLRRTAGAVGRYPLEAAIAAVHADRRRSGVTDWIALRALYAALVAIGGGAGARLGHVVALAETGAATAALDVLDAMTGVAAHQPYWATRAHVLRLLGRDPDDALSRAAGLSDDPAIRAFLLAQRGTG